MKASELKVGDVICWNSKLTETLTEVRTNPKRYIFDNDDERTMSTGWLTRLLQQGSSFSSITVHRDGIQIHPEPADSKSGRGL
jgi:hypothetical protein